MNAPTVIIVNYNGGDSTLSCLDALRHQTIEHRVVMIDNASSDGSARRVYERHPWVDIVPLRRNVGYARGVNLAVRRMSSADEVFVTLNPDTVPEPRFIERLIDPLRHDDAVGSVAGTLVFASSPSIVASAGITVHRNGVAIDAGLGTQYMPGSGTRPVFGASGGAAAYRLRAYRDIGGYFDPFFLYLEDVDLAWRLRLRGWESVATSGAVATHEYSSAAGEGSEFKRRLLARNRIWCLARCLPPSLWRRDRTAIALFDLAAIGYGIVRGDRAVLRGRAEAIAGLPARLAERSRIQRAAIVPVDELSRWIEPPISPLHLLRLRDKTAHLALRTNAP